MSSLLMILLFETNIFVWWYGIW